MTQEEMRAEQERLNRQRQNVNDVDRLVDAPNAQQQRAQEQALDRQRRQSEVINEMRQGIGLGRELLTSDPRMQETETRLQDLSRGYSGSELGALRGQAQSELAGQRSQYLRQLQSRAGRGGIGGARAAAMQGAADQGFAKAKGEQERKMALDNAQLVRSGTKDVTDFLLRQRMGELATGLGTGQMFSSMRAADAAREAAKPQRGGLFTEFFRGLGL
jgi:hypothetical protein